VVIGISASGSSERAFRASLARRAAGPWACSVGWGKYRGLVDIDLTVPGHDTPQFEAITIFIFSVVVEQALFGEKDHEI
jgi:hypothetical protein